MGSFHFSGEGGIVGSEDNRQQPWWADPSQTVVTSTAQTWTWRSTLTVLVVAGLIGIGLLATLIGPQTPTTGTWDWGITTRPSVDALAARCGPTYSVTAPPTDLKVGTIPDLNEKGEPFRAEYITVVPIIGVMSEKPVDTSAGKVFWRRDDTDIPRPEQVLRNMYDGWMVAYYSPKTADRTVESLGEFAEANPELKMLVVPWPTDRPSIPRNKLIAYGTWGAAQQCVDLLTAQVREFRSAHPAQAAPGFRPDSPPRELTFEDIPLAVLDPDYVPDENAKEEPPSRDPLRKPTNKWRAV